MGTETSSAFPPVLNKPTIVSPFGSFLANTCWLPVLSTLFAAIESWSTARTSEFFRYFCRSVWSR